MRPGVINIKKPLNQSHPTDRSIVNIFSMLSLDVRKNFFSVGAVRRCNRLPREVVESLSMEVLKEREDRVYGDVVSGQHWW